VISGIFVGLSTVDVVYGVDRFPAPDTKITANTQEIFVGGPASNAAIAFRHLGGEAALVTGAGRHPLSALLRQELQHYGIRLCDLSPHFEDIPALSSVWVDAAGQRNVVSANATRIPISSLAIDEELCRQASILLVDGHFMPACQRWAAAARVNGTPVVLDGGSWKPGTADLLASVTTAVCSADFFPPGCSTHSEVIAYLHERGVRQVAISRGDQPILASADGRQCAIPVPEVRLVDTSGAGDILHGAFCFFTAAGLPFREALERASRIASESCRYRGTREWMQHAAALTN
jgi:sugar/nucleoside kinase (ribokinase family)